MDDAGRPLDAPGEPDGTENGTAGDGVTPVGDPVAAYAPPPREEAAPRLDLERDPFAAAAPVYPVLDPEPFVPAIDAVPEPALFATEAEGEEPAEETATDDAAGEAPAADGFDAVVAGFAAAAAGPEDAAPADAAELSLEEMVGDLAAEEGTVEVSEEGAEAGPEVQDDAESENGSGTEDAGEDADAVAEEETEAPESWRDAVAASEAAGFEGPELARDRLSTRLPFWLYGTAWAIFVGTMTYLMWPLADKPFVDALYYGYLVYGGVAMLVVGLVLAIVVWIVGRIGTSPVERSGLGRAICMRAAGWMTVGVLLWWAGMYALDMHRLGQIG